MPLHRLGIPGNALTGLGKGQLAISLAANQLIAQFPLEGRQATRNRCVIYAQLPRCGAQGLPTLDGE